jgi:hypothetical protein
VRKKCARNAQKIAQKRATRNHNHLKISQLASNSKKTKKIPKSAQFTKQASMKK